MYRRYILSIKYYSIHPFISYKTVAKRRKKKPLFFNTNLIYLYNFSCVQWNTLEVSTRDIHFIICACDIQLELDCAPRAHFSTFTFLFERENDKVLCFACGIILPLEVVISFLVYMQLTNTERKKKIRASTYLKFWTPLLRIPIGIRPSRWARNSSWRTDEFSLILTLWIATVGTFKHYKKKKKKRMNKAVIISNLKKKIQWNTSAIITLLKALAMIGWTPERVNFIKSWQSSVISISGRNGLDITISTPQETKNNK